VDFDPWTCSFEDAIEFEDKSKNKCLGGNQSPIMQASAVGRANQLKDQVISGDGFSLLAVIRICASHGLVIPTWAVKQYITKYDVILNCRASSWDDAFGKPYQGKHLKKLKQRRDLRHPVYMRVREILSSKSRPPIDKGLFEEVGEHFGIKATYAEELYREGKELMEFKKPAKK